MPTLAIVGAGPGLGAAIARRFGREAYRVAVMSRHPDQLADDLRAVGVDAHPYVADVLRPHVLNDALTQAADELDGIDILEYSPMDPASFAPVDAIDMTIDGVSSQIEHYLYGGITAVQAVLPAMLGRGSGTIIVTTGASSGPIVHPPYANIAAASGALRNWTLNLHAALAPKGVYAAHVAIAAFIGQGGPKSQPDTIAESYWQLVQDRSEAELFYVDDTLQS
jgi:NAD(P)-dependent dehydrogenase (short-subunit alcohol dehydrogenase family)